MSESVREQGVQHKTVVGFRERMAFGLGDLGTNIAFGALATYVVFFYTDVVGAAAAAIGTIMLVSRVLDGVSDIAMGAVIDRTRTKYGRARPWLLRLSAPFGVSLVLVFTVPPLGDTATLIYIAITYNVLMLLFTGVVMPYGTLNTLMVRDKDERSALNVTRMFFATAGLIVVTALTVPMVELFGGGQSGWIYTFCVFAVISIAIYYYTFAQTRERIHSIDKQPEPQGFMATMSAMKGNRYWILLVLVIFSFSVAEALYQGAAAYYANSILDNTGYVAILSALLFVPSLVCLPFMQPLYVRFGKARTMTAGAVLFVAGTAVIMIDPTNIVLVATGTVIRGIGRTPIFGAIWGMLPDTIEYGEWKTRKRIEAVLYSAGSFGQKAGYGIGSAMLGWILALGGYIGGQSEQSESALVSINALFLYLPAVMYIVLIILLVFYKLDKVYPTVARDLELRRAQSDAEPDKI